MSIMSSPLERANVDESVAYGQDVPYHLATYTGQLKDGFRHGLGQLVDADGCTYTGDFYNNQKHGFGVFVNSMKNSYSGRFKSGLMHEGGIVTCLNGDRYEVQYNSGQLIYTKKIKGAPETKLQSLAEKALEVEMQVLKMIREGGKKTKATVPKATKRLNGEENFSEPSNGTSSTNVTVEMFGEDEDEPAARSAPVTPPNQRAQLVMNEEVHYADPSELCVLPSSITDRGDWHWDELQSSEAAKFLSAYGKEGSFLVRTRPMTNNENALAALLAGQVHHFKFEFQDGCVMLGGIKKKTIPLLLAHFLKNKIYNRSTLVEPLVPYIDIIKKVEAMGFKASDVTKAYKATRSSDVEVLSKWVKDHCL